MIDPILSLAIAIQSDPGIYALLVGSGVSRAAGIPTGWEVVLDLIRKLAVLMKEDCDPAPDAWYRSKFGEDPDYARLLDDIAKTPAERQQLLRTYFEPTATDIEAGLKVPTAAHRAIADLVKRNYVRLILTTNFDRLIEKALEAEGVAPTVISTADQILGARPLAHSGCTVVKVNGDYLDSRIKNTPAELADYDPHWNRFLDRIFDEYGLIVVGWSAVWDTALWAAMERCPTHRFTTFWASKGEIGEQAAGLLKRRRAVSLNIDAADSFFQSLSEKIVSLEEINISHPLSAQVAVATLKRYLSEDRHKIRARDLVLDEAKRLIAECNRERFPVDIPSVTLDDLILRMRQYGELTHTLLALFSLGAYWGDGVHESIWSDCLGLIAESKGLGGGNTAYINLQDYPAVLLMYGAGISAVAANRYGNLAAVLTRPTRENPSLQREEPLATLLNPNVVIEPRAAQKVISPGRKHFTPVNDYLAVTMRDPLRDVLARDVTFNSCFDRFEYLWSLVRIDLNSQLKSSSRWMVGRFLWRDEKHYDYKQTELERLYAEMDKAGDDWVGLRAGLFGGSLSRLLAARQEFDEARPNLRQSIGVW